MTMPGTQQVLNKITVIIITTEQETNLIPEYLGEFIFKIKLPLEVK